MLVYQVGVTTHSFLTPEVALACSPSSNPASAPRLMSDGKITYSKNNKYIRNEEKLKKWYTYDIHNTSEAERGVLTGPNYCSYRQYEQYEQYKVVSRTVSAV